MAVKAVVFDCDGVMFESRQANRAYYEHILDHFDKGPLAAEAIEFVHAHASRESVEYLFAGDPRLPEALAFEAGMDYNRFIDLMRPEPGLRELLAWAGGRFKRAVWTNRTRTINRVLKTHDLTDYFELVVSAATAPPKPDPAGMRLILDRFGLEAEAVIYVGDSLVDQAAATRAGVFLVAYKNRSLKADLYVDDFDALCRWLTESD